MASLAQMLAQTSFGRRPTGPVNAQAFDAMILRYQPVIEALLAQRHQNAVNYGKGRSAAQFSGTAAAQGIGRIRDQFVQSTAPLAELAAKDPSSRVASNLGLSGQAVAGILSEMQAQQVAGIGQRQNTLRDSYTTGQQALIQQLGSSLSQAGTYRSQIKDQLLGDKHKSEAAAAKDQRDYEAGLAKAGLTGDGKGGFAYDPSLNAPSKPKAPSFTGPGGMYTADQWAAMSPGQRAAANKRFGKRSALSKPTLPGGVDLLPQGEHNTMRARITGAATTASTIATALRKDHPGMPKREVRRQVGLVLTNGAKGIQKVSPDVAGVALDIALDTHVSGGKVNLLHRQGYSIKKLGLPTLARPRIAGGTRRY